jgi:sporulation protein YlmC with PRC-barrel domain
VELSRDRPFAFSELIGRRVEDQNGRPLGRVLEVRAHWEGDGTILLDELLVGRGALWRRLRGPSAAAGGIPWANVTELSPDRVIVQANG